MKGIAEAKAAIINSRNQDELYQAVSGICRSGLFKFDDSLTLEENAALARLCHEPRVADLLEFARIYEERL